MVRKRGKEDEGRHAAKTPGWDLNLGHLHRRPSDTVHRVHTAPSTQPTVVVQAGIGNLSEEKSLKPNIWPNNSSKASLLDSNSKLSMQPKVNPWDVNSYQ